MKPQTRTVVVARKAYSWIGSGPVLDRVCPVVGPSWSRPGWPLDSKTPLFAVKMNEVAPKEKLKLSSEWSKPRISRNTRVAAAARSNPQTSIKCIREICVIRGQ